MFLTNEDKRRRLSKEFDSEPTYVHYFNFKFSKEYIKNRTVLDVGCWSGQFEQISQNYVRKIYGIDPGKDAIKMARRNARKAIFKDAKAEKLPFKSSLFDVVLLMDVLEHLPKESEEVVLYEINRVLKKGGVLVLNTPYKNLLSIIFDPSYFVLGHKHYSLKELKLLFHKTNFLLLKNQIHGNLVGSIYSNCMLLFKYLLRMKPAIPSKIQKFIAVQYEKPGFSSIYLVAKKKGAIK